MTEIEVEVEGQPEPAGPPTRLIATVVPLLVGAGALVNSLLLGVGTPTAPGPGMWPAVASGIMVIAAVILLLRWKLIDDVERFDRGIIHIGLGIASLGVFVVLFGGVKALDWPGIGFEWSTLALLAFWLKVIGGESWKVTVLVSVAVTVAMHLFFIELFAAPLPHTIGG